jgi:hypothetical protein
MVTRRQAVLAGPAPTVSAAEDNLAAILRWEKLPVPEREVRFAAPRRFRADFLWGPPVDLIVEVEGGSYVGGRHVRGEGFESGCEQQAEATLLGYRYLRVTPRQIDSGQAIAWIKRALA